MSKKSAVIEIKDHLADLHRCQKCPLMVGPVVTHGPVLSKVIIIGQAPGPREGEFGKPFAWTAGVTLFKWFDRVGLNQEQVRAKTFISAVCRCFPGKTKAGSDRVPTPQEIANCSTWMGAEFAIMQPELVIPVGKLAIEQFMPGKPLTETVGQQFNMSKFGVAFDMIPLPHPSGASTWFKMEPGISLLGKGLALIDQHPAWQRLR